MDLELSRSLNSPLIFSLLGAIDDLVTDFADGDALAFEAAQELCRTADRAAEL